jgi:hypothetical protein
VISPDEKEGILYAFAVEWNHDQTTLERYLNQYPELAEEIVDLLSEIRLGEAYRPDYSVSIPDPGADAAWQEFIASAPQQARVTESPDPFALFFGHPFADLADALNVPRSFLTPFRDGLVEAASIPAAFTRRLAAAMDATFESLQAHFLTPSSGPIARAFKSEKTPSHQGQATFRELIDNTEMSDEQRRLLLQDLDADGSL